MRNALFSSGSRKRMSVDNTRTLAELNSQRHKPALVASLVHNTSGTVQLSSKDSPQTAMYSSASFNANDLSSDSRVLQVGDDHLFAMVVKSTSSARGGNYLRQHLYQELLAQRRKHPGNLQLALQNSIAELNKGFQSLHPFNLDVLQSVQVVIAFTDFTAQRLYVASNGGCRCVLGCIGNGGAVEIVADVGRLTEMEENNIALISNIADIHLNREVDVMVLGSSGFWNEVAPFKAVLRAHHFYRTAPHASKNSLAANLINYTLHCVTQRLKAHPDRRMVSLNSVSNLVSLQAGHKGQFKYGHKQPVRRRRADVHDDMTAVATFLDWEGQLRGKQIPESSGQSRSKSKWAIVRMVYQFHIASSNHNTRAWQALVSALQSQLRDAKTKNENFSSLKISLHSSSHSRSSADSSTSAMSAADI